jgi:hypothetical protein
MIYLKGKVCPNMNCEGILEIQACRGHGGYPVTHFWRHVSTLGILFQVSELFVQFVNYCFSVLFDISLFRLLYWSTSTMQGLEISTMQNLE